MTGSGPRPPRPPRRKASRGRRSVSPGEPGRCYLCAAPARSQCPQCHRPVCDAHRVLLPGEMQPLFGPNTCAECARFATDDLGAIPQPVFEGTGDKPARKSRKAKTTFEVGRQGQVALQDLGGEGCDGRHYHARPTSRVLVHIVRRMGLGVCRILGAHCSVLGSSPAPPAA